MKKQLAFGILISAVCLYFAFKGRSFSSLAHALAHADPRWVIAAVLIYAVSYATRIWRWQILLEPIKRISYRELAAPLIIGFFANNILPFRMGELIRAHVSGRKFQIPRTASLGTIFIERLFDTISFLTTFLAVATFFPFPAFVEKGAVMLGTGCFCGLVFLWVINTHQDTFFKWISYSKLPAPWVAKIHEILRRFAEGVIGIKNFRNVARSFSLSLVIWIIEGTFLYFIMRAFNLQVHYASAFFLLFFLGLAVTLPQAPGYVGTMELFGVTALSFLGIAKNDALPVILAIHGIQFCFVAIIGLWALGSEGMSLKTLLRSNV